MGFKGPVTAMICLLNTLVGKEHTCFLQLNLSPTCMADRTCLTVQMTGIERVKHLMISLKEGNRTCYCHLEAHQKSFALRLQLHFLLAHLLVPQP